MTCDPYAQAQQLRRRLEHAAVELELGPLEHAALYLDAAGARRVATLRRQLTAAEAGAR